VTKGWTAPDHTDVASRKKGVAASIRGSINCRPTSDALVPFLPRGSAAIPFEMEFAITPVKWLSYTGPRRWHATPSSMTENRSGILGQLLAQSRFFLISSWSLTRIQNY
jgi:hypothetical protein